MKWIIALFVFAVMLTACTPEDSNERAVRHQDRAEVARGADGLTDQDAIVAVALIQRECDAR